MQCFFFCVNLLCFLFLVNLCGRNLHHWKGTSDFPIFPHLLLLLPSPPQKNLRSRTDASLVLLLLLLLLLPSFLPTLNKVALLCQQISILFFLGGGGVQPCLFQKKRREGERGIPVWRARDDSGNKTWSCVLPPQKKEAAEKCVTKEKDLFFSLKNYFFFSHHLNLCHCDLPNISHFVGVLEWLFLLLVGFGNGFLCAKWLNLH